MIPTTSDTVAMNIDERTSESGEAGEAGEAGELGDLHPIELVTHFFLSESLDNLQESFLLLHDSQQLLLNRLEVIEKKLNEQLELAKKRDFNVAQVRARIKTVSKKINEVKKIFDLIEPRLQVLEETIAQ